MFTEKEIEFLNSQDLLRIATFSEDGQADVAPVSFSLDGEKFIIPSLDMKRTLKYKNISAGNNKVALVVDDLLSTDPWQPRGIKIHGTAELVNSEGRLGKGLYIEVAPVKKWSWGINKPGLKGGKAVFDVKKKGEEDTKLEMG